MSSLKYSVVAVALALLVSPLVQAQDQSTPSGDGRRGQREGKADGTQGRGQMMNADARVQQLDRALTLTADQKTQVKAIYSKVEEDMRAQTRDGGGDQQANRAKLRDTMLSTRDQVRALLTDEQKIKFDAMPQAGAQRGRGSDGKGSDGSEQKVRGKKKE
jgi:Spy/CpxP family protein refolding chaperone